MGDAERFWDELSRTYQAAGSPVLARLVALGERRRPPLRSSDATISDWLSRKTVPGRQSSEFFLFMVGCLEARAVQRARKAGGSWTKRERSWWEQLLQQARVGRAQAPEDVGPTGPVQLPTPDDLFVGREEPLRTLLAWLEPGTQQAEAPGGLGLGAQDGSTTVIRTLASAAAMEVTGMGGVGKTALVVEAARLAAAHGWYPGGVLFADLRGHSPSHDAAPDETLDAFLRTLRPREEPLPVLADKLRRWQQLLDELAAQQRPLLIILDNVRQAGRITQLLPVLPHRALLTSRHTHPAIRHRLALAPFPPVEAELFVSLRLREPGDTPVTTPDGVTLSVPDEQVRRIAELCGQLPLALGIVVALLRTEPDRSLRERVDELARNLLDGMEDEDETDVEGRPLTVRACFSFCYEHLPASRARVFRLLASAPGQDVSTTSAAVLLGAPADEARLALRGLARMHLLERSWRGSHELSEAEREHWSMHDLIRVYAEERGRAHAWEDGREDAVGRLLHHYRDAARSAAAIPRGRGMEETLLVLRAHRRKMVWLEAERVNVVEAAISAPASAWRVDLALALEEFFSKRRYYAEWARLAASAIDACQRGHGDRRKEFRALGDLSEALTGLGRFDEALAALDDADEAAALLDDRARALVAQQRGVVLTEADRPEDAMRSHETSAAFFQQAGDPAGLAAARRLIGDTLARCGQYEDAEAAFQASLAYYRMAGDVPGEVEALGSLGNAQSLLGHHQEAIESLDIANEYAVHTQNITCNIIGLHDLGLALHRAGQPQAALTKLRNAEQLARMFEHHQDYLGAVLVCRGLVLKELGRLRAAHTALTEAVEVIREVGDAQRLAFAERALRRLRRSLQRRRIKLWIRR
ncbi:tetratricopeptide repeat protein [Streptomyces sp. NBC_01352]|uniref:tetratricopeptide repeat protein n=1 Tax=Streptomyces sp. NBC_01352 TaxID=2903834 RepID=UPI002E2F8B8A|nr:tetratricopeptide repeat protein [Streptomyces sp. NBC_01352]